MSSIFEGFHVPGIVQKDKMEKEHSIQIRQFENVSFDKH